jgi:NADP-dependent 3-hydroxy acid dehydrogenase YdfG
VVTGASSGFAELFAQRLAGPGMSLVLAGRNQSRIEEVAERTRTRLAWTLHPAGLGSMTISRRAEVQAGRGAAKGAERD